LKRCTKTQFNSLRFLCKLVECLFYFTFLTLHIFCSRNSSLFFSSSSSSRPFAHSDSPCRCLFLCHCQSCHSSHPPARPPLSLSLHPSSARLSWFASSVCLCPSRSALVLPFTSSIWPEIPHALHYLALFLPLCFLFQSCRCLAKIGATHIKNVKGILFGGEVNCATYHRIQFLALAYQQS
jgi:hypothetical protein